MSKTINCYNQNAEAFQQQYLSTSTQDVHKVWLESYLPKSGVVLDVGAGVGRDAKYFAEQGLEVIAVEPAKSLRELGEAYTVTHSVQWIDDTLPELSKVNNLQIRFDAIVLSAVWMHLPSSHRDRAFRKLANLLKPSGYLIISLRHGPNSDDREMHEVSIDELAKLSQKYGLSVKHAQADDDTLERKSVYWETVVMQLPDDGSGSFPTIRNILMNDAKSSTYKLALIRTLLRIADGHPGAVIRREDNRVILPLGLVSLYWARQYKVLLDANIQQNSNPEKGLGFIKADGWDKLDEFTGLDFAIGNLFLDEQANSLHKTLKHISTTICNMPVKYIRLPNTDQQVFEAETKRTANQVDSLYLDFETLSQYGGFSVPEKIWELMTLYACWIEPVVVNEWVQVMKDYKNNLAIPNHQLLERLEWLEAKRTTQLARDRVEAIKQDHSVYCVWSHVALEQKYDIDHCLPFARWPNNDLWNLLPTTMKVNQSKKDRIPTSICFTKAKDNILYWWQEAWDKEYRKRFFSQANISLPGLAANNESLEDIFEALKVQSIRVAEMQQLNRWCS